MTIKDQVEKTLQRYEQGRNSDQWLTLKIWADFYPNKIHRDENDRAYVYLKDVMDLPREDHVKRIRATFQNDFGMYLPDENVSKQRKKNEKKWRTLKKDFIIEE